MLSRRDYSEKILKQKLLDKGHPLTDIESTINDLAASGLINDERYAEHYIHYRRSRGFGPKRIAFDLKNDGISDAIIAELLNITDNDWQIDLQRVWQKQFKAFPTDLNARAKQIRFLQNRGFTLTQIEKLFLKLQE